ncbi:MAG: XdhC/CoxI family protein [Pseudomonadota bacterium]
MTQTLDAQDAVVRAAHDAIPEAALAWMAQGKAVALATVVQTWGSAPRPTGSQLAISEEAEIMGSVSGGCVEGAVVAEALEALEDGACRILEYGVADEEAFAVGLACGGTIRILVEPVDIGQGPTRAQLQALAEARATRRPVAWAVNVQTWERRLLDGSEAGAEEAATRLASDRSGFDAAGTWFYGLHNPPLRMIVVGAVHIAQALMPMARLAGYDAALVDPREAFGAEHRFPGERIVHDWPDEALDALGLDARTAVVTLTHDPKLDDPAIRRALASDVFYLGCLGSKKTHAKRTARLEAAGFEAGRIARIHAPVGADIGASTPAEIAVAALAQITERLRRPQTRPGAVAAPAEAAE